MIHIVSITTNDYTLPGTIYRTFNLKYVSQQHKVNQIKLVSFIHRICHRHTKHIPKMRVFIHGGNSYVSIVSFKTLGLTYPQTAAPCGKPLSLLLWQRSCHKWPPSVHREKPKYLPSDTARPKQVRFFFEPIKWVVKFKQAGCNKCVFFWSS